MIRRSGFVIGRIPSRSVYRRFIRSETSGISNAPKPATTSGGGRSISYRIRKPGPGCMSADFGLPTPAIAYLRGLPAGGTSTTLRVCTVRPGRRGPRPENANDNLGSLMKVFAFDPAEYREQ